MRLIPCIAVLLCVAPLTAPAQKKEILDLSRDLALLQEEVRSNNKAQSDRLAAIEATLKAIQDQLASTSRAVTVLDGSLRDRVEKSMVGPLANVGSKVDNLGQDFGYVKESVNEINTRLGKLDQRISDLANAVKTLQAPPPAPVSPAAPAAPSGPPAGVTAKGLYDDALRDKMAGNAELAQKEFTDYLAWFGDTEFAPNAQYYIGELLFNQKLYDQAIPAFDRVLEAYPKNPKTLDAHLMKGKALVRLGQRSEGEKEFRAILSAAPNSDAAARARAELKDLGLGTGTRPPASRKKN